MYTITIRVPFEGKEEETEKLQSLFSHWLDALLSDEGWRAIIAAEIEQHELPIIRMNT